MQRMINILTKVAAAVLAVVLAAGCVFEKETPMGDGRTRDVLVLLDVATSDMTLTKADSDTEGPTGENVATSETIEKTINTLRVFVYDNTGKQIGYAFQNFSTPSTSGIEINHMVIKLNAPEYYFYTQEPMENVKFYVIANEAATGLKNTFSENMSIADLHAILFSPVAYGSVLPMYGIETVAELKLAEGTVHDHSTEDYTDKSLLLNDKVSVNLTRSLAKIAVYAAEVGDETGSTENPKVQITGITVSNVVSKSALLVPETLPATFVEGGATMLSSDVGVDVTKTITTDAAAAVYQNDQYYTLLATSYFAENAAGSNNWAAVGEENGMVLNISYTAGGSEVKTQPIYMPKIQRNHFYKVLCRISAGGEMTLDINVLEWDDAEEQTIEFENNVALKTGFGWIGGTDDSTNAKLSFGYEADQTATFHFTLETPKNGKWYASIDEGDLQNFAFVEDGVEKKTVSGNITGAESTFTIKTLDQLALGESKAVKIRLLAVTADQSRSLVVKFGTHDYYTIEQRYN